MKKLLPLAITALMLVAISASADTLWDQSVPNPALGGVNDSQSGCGPSGSTIMHANDVSFTDAVQINSVSTWYTADDPDFEVYATTAYLMIVPKTGVTPNWPADNPTLEATVPVSVTVEGGYKKLTASGLAIDLLAGDYWLTFSPIAFTPLGVTDQHMLATSQIGDGASFLILCDQFTPEGWYTSNDFFGEPLDSTLLVEGMVMGSVPNESSSMGAIKSLFSN